MRNKNELRKLLLKQYELYPKAQLQDMVKLIYQNEFAGGHMIDNQRNSLRRLQEEFSELKPDSRAKPVPNTFERIGNGLCRLHLEALQGWGIDITTINKFFVNTANSVRGNIQSFEKKLDILKQCCRDGSLPYSVEDLKTYLHYYKIQGYPPISHSQDYRTLYEPAYRIVKVEYCHYLEVFRKIDSLMRLHDTVQVAIDGNAGAGKTTLARIISSVYDCNIFHMDDFFLTPELKTRERLEEIGGNVDYVRFRREVIEGLQTGGEFQYQIYDCKKKVLDKYISVNPKKLNIIEGVYSMHPTLIDNYDLKIFLTIDEKEQSKRILKRNGTAMQKRFVNQWIPLENRYFDKMKIREQSDLIFQGCF